MNVTGASRASVAAALLAVLTTTGCQSAPTPAALGRTVTFGDLSADAIMAATLADMRKQQYISLAGTWREKESLYTVRAKLGPKASCHYEIVGSEGKVDVLMVAGDAYWKYSERMLRSLVGQSQTEDAFVAKAADKWIEGQAPSGDEAEFCIRSRLLKYIEKQLDDGDPEVQSNSLGGVYLTAPGVRVTLEGHKPHLVDEMVDNGGIIDFRYHDSTPIERPRAKDIVVIPGFTPEGAPV